MALAREHNQAATVVALTGSALLVYTLPEPISVYLSLGLLIGRYAGPDLRDQAQVRNGCEQLVHDEFGWLPGFLWSFYWFPLAKRIRHRNWRSHLPGPATMIAWLYLFIPVVLAVFFFAGAQWGIWSLTVALYTLPGWVFQDFVHLVQDGFDITYN